MKKIATLPCDIDYGIDTSSVQCPFCDDKNKVHFESMTGGAANEMLMRCAACCSFFYVLKDPSFLRCQEGEKVW